MQGNIQTFSAKKLKIFTPVLNRQFYIPLYLNLKKCGFILMSLITFGSFIEKIKEWFVYSWK